MWTGRLAEGPLALLLRLHSDAFYRVVVTAKALGICAEVSVCPEVLVLTGESARWTRLDTVEMMFREF